MLSVHSLILKLPYNIFLEVHYDSTMQVIAVTIYVVLPETSGQSR
jgi:hypothetical protein